ncbi:pentapeptide repeat-containing protein [Nocardia sp. NPDC004573]
MSEGEKPARRGPVELRWRSVGLMVGGAGVAGFGVAALSGVTTSFSQPLATILAGAGALGAGALAYLNGQRTRELDAAHHQADTDRERERHQLDSRRTRESALRDRYTVVAAQIAHDSAAIRQAGIYALTALADDWHAFGEEDERQVCIDLLQWYLRVPFPVGDDPERPDLSEREIRQTIVGILSQRRERPDNDPRSWKSTTIRLNQVSLPGCNLSGLDLAGLNLHSTNLTGAFLTQANLNGAYLGGAKLVGAELNFAKLRGAKLYTADLNGANLEYATLTGAELANANLVGAKLRGAKLVNADLSHANLTGADLNGVDLTGANLYTANLTDANLAGANVIRANLTGANVTNAHLVTSFHNGQTRWPEGFP